MNWWQDLKREIKFCEPLSKHTTFKIGGVVDIWFEPKSIKTLKRMLSLCRKKDIPFRILGWGSNILVKDGGLKGVIAHLNSECFSKIKVNNSSITVGCGVSLKRLVEFTKKNNLGGCEFLAGIPGTVGGALVMNAGVRDIFNSKKNKFLSISDIIDEISVIDKQGRIKNLKRKQIRFRYRRSSLGNVIILKAKIKLSEKSKKDIISTMDKFMQHKKKTQDLSYPSAGCIFRNPKNENAANLIEKCGFKGLRIGGAQISTKHANFIINRNFAQARDVLALINLVGERVRVEYNINIKPEVRIWGDVT